MSDNLIEFPQDGVALERRERHRPEQEIARFAAAVDDRGQPLHPHFNRVRRVMATLLSDEIADGLDDAYERAVRTLA